MCLCPSLIVHLLQRSVLTVGALTVGWQHATVRVTAKVGSEVNRQYQNRLKSQFVLSFPFSSGKKVDWSHFICYFIMQCKLFARISTVKSNFSEDDKEEGSFRGELIRHSGSSSRGHFMRGLDPLSVVLFLMVLFWHRAGSNATHTSTDYPCQELNSLLPC